MDSSQIITLAAAASESGGSSNTSQIVSIGIAAATAVAGLLVFFKYKPGQRETVVMKVAEASIDVASGTILMVETNYQRQLDRMAAELKEVRDTLERMERKYMSEKTRAEELAVENAELRKANADLHKRVAGLERKVTALTAANKP